MPSLHKPGIFFNFVEVGFWNISGIFHKVGSTKYSKLNETEFLTTISQLDILCIAESHIGQNEENIEIDGFDHFLSCRRASNNNRFLEALLFTSKRYYVQVSNW